MNLWYQWWRLVRMLRPASSRLINFLWFSLSLVGMTIRSDHLGVTSIIRALGLKGKCYVRLLDFFRSPGLNLSKLVILWTKLVLKYFSTTLLLNGRLVLVGDGLKVGKAGKKMPAVKCLHQESESNTKPNYIMGHSLQVVSILVGALENLFAVPLVGRIHEGVVFSNRDSKTLMHKMILLIKSLGIDRPFYFIADAYYSTRTIIKGIFSIGGHLISRVKTNAVAFKKAALSDLNRGRGRPKIYGEKIKLKSIFNDTSEMESAPSPVYGENGVKILFRALDLLWRPVGVLVRFVLVIHPTRGKIILMATDLNLLPIDIIRAYGMRFKIEVSFKQAIHTFGIFSYHFWMKEMWPIHWGSGNQFMHRMTDKYRAAVREKIETYHRFIQVGMIAHGLLQYLSIAFPKKIWNSFGSWMRTMRTDACPSERVTSMAMRNSYPEFLMGSQEVPILVKFIRERMDLGRAEGILLAG